MQINHVHQADEIRDQAVHIDCHTQRNRVKLWRMRMVTNCLRIICILILHSIQHLPATLFTSCRMYYSLVFVICSALKNVCEVFVQLPNVASTIEFDSCFCPHQSLCNIILSEVKKNLSFCQLLFRRDFSVFFGFLAFRRQQEHQQVQVQLQVATG